MSTHENEEIRVEVSSSSESEEEESDGRGSGDQMDYQDGDQERDVEDEDGEDQDDEEEEEEDGIGGSSVLMLPKRKVKNPSPIWKECASKVYSESGCVIGGKCNFCGKVYKSKTGNTSNLTRHVTNRHKVDHKAEVGRMVKE